MKISLIQVPYHYGFLEAKKGTGRAPARLLAAGAEQNLRRQGFDVTVGTVQRSGEAGEIPAAVIEANSDLAEKVRRARETSAQPLVLGGPCSSCLGVLAGLGASVGIVWFDAHGDFNTPETTPSGFFEGMPLAVAVGLCYEEIWGGISAAAPVPPAHVLLVGVRDVDPGEWDNLRRSGANAVTAEEIEAGGLATALEPKLVKMRSRVEEIYLHFDIDVLTTGAAPAVDFRAPGGLSLAQAEEAIAMIAGRFRVRGAALTAYNPEREESDQTLTSALRLLDSLASALATSPA